MLLLGKQTYSEVINEKSVYNKHNWCTIIDSHMLYLYL